MNRISLLLSAAVYFIATAVHADDRSERATSLTQLRTLGQLVSSYVTTNDGRFPKTLDELIASQKSADRSLLIAPMATDKSKPSYELTLPAERASQVVNPARTVLIRSRYKLADGQVPVLFVDGHVEFAETR